MGHARQYSTDVYHNSPGHEEDRESYRWPEAVLNSGKMHSSKACLPPVPKLTRALPTRRPEHAECPGAYVGGASDGQVQVNVQLSMQIDQKHTCRPGVVGQGIRMMLPLPDFQGRGWCC